MNTRMTDRTGVQPLFTGQRLPRSDKFCFFFLRMLLLITHMRRSRSVAAFAIDAILQCRTIELIHLVGSADFDRSFCPYIRGMTPKTIHRSHPAKPDAIRGIMRTIGPAML